MKTSKRFLGVFRTCGVAALATAMTLSSVSFLAVPAKAAGAAKYNYAEALQKSLYFYDAEKSGQGITGGHLEWRGTPSFRIRIFLWESTGRPLT
ncbi:hypothetical protein ACFQY3_18065 [Paenibacillus farraposensis]|uniref:hypothetical protein n=1 Tax=Paenibacillus farraposensis TaxID=2807095 RepID=UPI003606237E